MSGSEDIPAGAREVAAERRIAWAADVFACLYFAWNYFVLARHTAALGATIEGLGAKVPAPTAFVLANHGWLHPVVFGLAAAVVVAKEAWVRDKRISVCVTFTIALAVLWISDYVKTVLFYPLIGLLEQLG